MLSSVSYTHLEKTYLIPAVKDIFITDIDEEAREISVHMIEGLETDED